MRCTREYIVRGLQGEDVKGRGEKYENGKIVIKPACIVEYGARRSAHCRLGDSRLVHPLP